MLKSSTSSHRKILMMLKYYDYSSYAVGLKNFVLRKPNSRKTPAKCQLSKSTNNFFRLGIFGHSKSGTVNSCHKICTLKPQCFSFNFVPQTKFCYFSKFSGTLKSEMRHFWSKFPFRVQHFSLRSCPTLSNLISEQKVL